MKVYKTDGGYYFKEYQNGKKVRISQEQFLNFKKNAKKSKHSRKISKKCCKKMKGGGTRQELIKDLNSYTHINGTSNLIQELELYDGDDIEELYDIFDRITKTTFKNQTQQIIENIYKKLKEKVEEKRKLKWNDKYSKKYGNKQNYINVLNTLINLNESINNKNGIKNMHKEMLGKLINIKNNSIEFNKFINQQINARVASSKKNKKIVMNELSSKIPNGHLKKFITDLQTKNAAATTIAAYQRGKKSRNRTEKKREEAKAAAQAKEEANATKKTLYTLNSDPATLTDFTLLRFIQYQLSLPINTQISLGYTNIINKKFIDEYNKRIKNLITELEKYELNKLNNNTKVAFGRRIWNLLPIDYRTNDSLKEKINKLRNFYKS